MYTKVNDTWFTLETSTFLPSIDTHDEQQHSHLFHDAHKRTTTEIMGKLRKIKEEALI